MSLAKTVNTTTAPGARASRRSMLGSAALAFTAAASAIGITAGAAASVADLVPNESADAALLAICAKAEAADRLMMQADAEHDLHRRQGREAERQTVGQECDDRFDEFVDLAEKAAVIPAHTVEGMRAKARLVYLNMNTTLEDGELTALILRDIGWGA